MKREKRKPLNSIAFLKLLSFNLVFRYFSESEKQKKKKRKTQARCFPFLKEFNKGEEIF